MTEKKIQSRDLSCDVDDGGSGSGSHVTSLLKWTEWSDSSDNTGNADTVLPDA